MENNFQKQVPNGTKSLNRKAVTAIVTIVTLILSVITFAVSPASTGNCIGTHGAIYRIDGSGNGCVTFKSCPVGYDGEWWEDDFMTSIDGYELDYIDSYSFYHCAGLTVLELPRTIEYILFGAFNYCSNLRSIYGMPDKVNGFYGNCDWFAGCESLESIDIPEGITGINGAFQNCSSLKTITLPESVVFKGNGFNGKTFKNCTSLECIKIHSNSDVDIELLISAIQSGTDMTYSQVKNMIEYYN